MFKSIATLILVLGSTAAFAIDKMPEGQYDGVGRFKDQDGKTGSYNVSVVIKGDDIASTYNYGTTSKSFTVSAPIATDGTFPVVVNGTKIGGGYCFSTQCHYALAVGDFSLEETLTFYENHLYRLGSKVVEGKTTMWEESTELKK
jgi:hypothetical protein